MQAIVLHELGEPDRLQLEAVPTPEPAAGEVRVRLHAAALNHRDVWIRRGKYPRIQLPAILGSDGAGTIDAVGPGVDGAAVGREVLICPSLGWGDDPRVQGRGYHIVGMPGPGTYAEYLCVPAANAVVKPSHLSWSEAAALPLAGLTAWRAVVTRGRVRPGDRVLVTGAGGGVASLALRWAVHWGAEVWVSSSDPAKIAAAEAAGARGGVDYTQAGWDAELRERAGGDLDLIVDGSGGPGFAQLVGLAAPGGRVVVYGATRGKPSEPFDIHRLFFRHVEILGSTMGTIAEFRELCAFVAAREIRPQVDEVRPLAEAAQAHARMEAGAQTGKIVLAMD